MIRAAFKNLWNLRSQNLWIFIELALVTIIAWKVLDEAAISIAYRSAPLGYDADRLAILSFNTIPEQASNYSEEAADSAVLVAEYNAIAEKLRNHDGVECFTYTGDNIIINSGALIMHSHIGNEFSDSVVHKHMIASLHYYTNENFFKTYGISFPEGMPNPETLETSTYEDNLKDERTYMGNFVITHDLAKHLFKNYNPGVEEGSGSTVNDINFSNIVNVNIDREVYPIGYEWIDSSGYANWKYRLLSVVDDVRYGRHLPSYSLLFSPAKRPDKPSKEFKIVVRLYPDKSPERFVSELLADRKSFDIGNYYLQSAFTYIEQMESVEEGIGINSQRRLAIVLAVFFLINLILGVTGTFTIQARKRMVEMGIRRSFGANKSDIIMLMLTEGLILTTLAFIVGDLLYLQYALKEGLARGVNSNVGIPAELWVWNFTSHFLVISLVIYLLLAICTIIGILFPATRIANINPVDALRDE